MTAANARVRAGLVRLVPGDAGELLTLQLAAWVHEAIQCGRLDIPPLHETVDDVRRQLADGPVWGVREDGRLTGTVRVRTVRPGVGFVARLGVVPDQRGTGLGGALLRHAEGLLRADGLTRVELVTGLQSTDNHAFYAHHGYAIVSSDPGPGTVTLRKQLDEQLDERADADDDDGGAQRGR